MAALDREAIYVALAAALGTIAGVTTPCSRVFRMAMHVDPSEQPAVFLESDGETPENQVKGLPPVLILHAKIIIYARTDTETGVSASSVINPILKSIQTALNFNGGDAGGMSTSALTTLRGLLISAKYDGKTEIGENVETRQGFAIVPIALRATGGG